MIPLIIVSKDLEKQEKFLLDFIKENKINQYHVYKISPLKTEITIDQIREIKKQIITHSTYMRVFVCYSFDTANIEAQNAFLKTLEEKNEQNQFILFSKNIERLLPTIRSRSTTHFLDTNIENHRISDSNLSVFKKAFTSEEN